MGVVIETGDIIFLDISPFIYFFEWHQDYFPALEKLFAELYKTDAQAITSIITYIELTTHLARLGNQKLVRKYRDYLTNSENISLFPLNLDIADHVVQLRAQYRFKTPDAIQLGTAVASGADYIITNDRAWQVLGDVKVVLVGEL